MEKGLQIGSVSAQTGLTVDAIRFYERARLLPTAPRSIGGFRLFGKHDIEELRFIRKAQTLGFSLEEIRELISLRKHELSRDLHACRIALKRTTRANCPVLDQIGRNGQSTRKRK